jgi:hypothetical protein
MPEHQACAGSPQIRHSLRQAPELRDLFFANDKEEQSQDEVSSRKIAQFRLSPFCPFLSVDLGSLQIMGQEHTSLIQLRDTIAAVVEVICCSVQGRLLNSTTEWVIFECDGAACSRQRIVVSECGNNKGTYRYKRAMERALSKDPSRLSDFRTESWEHPL